MTTGIRAIITLLCVFGLIACNNEPTPRAEAAIHPPAAINDSTGLTATTKLLQNAKEVVVA